MRIATVTHYSELYGANRSLLSLIEGLRAYGVKVNVLVPEEGPISDELSSRGVPFYAIPFKRWMSRDQWKAPARFGMNLAALPFLANKVCQWNVDLIHTNSSVTPVGALLAKMLSLPHVWHIREFGERDFGLSYDWGRFLFRKLVSSANATIAVSKAVHRHVLSDIDIPCHIVYNGVISRGRLEDMRRQAKLRQSRRSPIYTFAIVGKISPAKGQKQALRALHCLKQQGRKARLLLAGDGTSKHVKSIQHLCQSLNLSCEVSFLGYVSDPFRVYQRADAVLMCSPHEAMGRVTAEAMATARPVIGYDSDGTAELIEDGHNGLLYDGSIEDLAGCMVRFLNNPNWAQELGLNGWEKANKEFTNEVYARQINNVLCEVAGESTRKIA